jgi:hypothetical protein
VEAPQPPAPTSALPLAASPLAPPSIVLDHFGFEVTLSCPLLTPAALLSSVVRLEAAIAEMNLPLPPNVPATRAEAVATGWQGPTREDHEDQKQITTKFVEWHNDDGSNQHEQDWMRFLTCYNPWNQPPMRDRVYTPGMLDGLWVGRWFVRIFPSLSLYISLIATCSPQGIPMNEFATILASEQTPQPAAAPDPPLVYPVPMQFRIRYDAETSCDELPT